MRYFVTIDGQEFKIELDGGPSDAPLRVAVDGQEVLLEPVAPLEPAGESAGREFLASAGARRLTVVTLPGGGDRVRLLAGNQLVEARVESERDRLRARSRPQAQQAERIRVASTLPGVIRRVLLQTGARVEAGTAILTLEAMKMENEVRAEGAGRLSAVLVKEGQVVNAGDILVEIDTTVGS